MSLTLCDLGSLIIIQIGTINRPIKTGPLHAVGKHGERGVSFETATERMGQQLRVRLIYRVATSRQHLVDVKNS